LRLMHRQFTDSERIAELAPAGKGCALDRLTWTGLPGRVGHWGFPSCIEDLGEAIRSLEKDQIPFRVVGNTSNLLIQGNLEPLVILSTTKCKQFKDLGDNRVEVDCGLSLSLFARKTAALGLKGVEGLAGIPGTVGGALYMNAGSYENTISDHLEWVECYTRSKGVFRLYREEMIFKYRISPFQSVAQDFIILRACFRLQKADSQDLLSRIAEINIHRKTRQEQKIKNLGSCFATKDIYSELSEGRAVLRFLLNLVRRNIIPAIRLRNPNSSWANNRLMNLILVVWFLRPRLLHCVSNYTFNCFLFTKDNIPQFKDYCYLIRTKSRGKLRQEVEIIDNEGKTT